MARFDPRPAEAVQFTGRESIEIVASLVRKYHPHINHVYIPSSETLRFYDDSTEHLLKLWYWAAVVGETIVVLPPSMIEGSAGPASI